MASKGIDINNTPGSSNPVEVAAANLDQAASDVCQCAQEPYAQMEQLKGVVQQAVTSGDYAQMMKLEGDFAGLQDRALSC